MKPIAIIIGATGLVGSHLLRQLHETGRYHKIYSVIRQAQPPIEGVVQIIEKDFAHVNKAIQSLNLEGADVFITLGTTIKIAKTKQRFYQVDHDFALLFAKTAKELGAKHCLLLTAMGASADSVIFYNRVKGQVEQDIQALGFDKLSIFRPALLLGRAKNNRQGEKISEVGFALLNPLMPKHFALRPIHAAQVAQSMVFASQRLELGTKVYSNSQMLTLTVE